MRQHTLTLYDRILPEVPPEIRDDYFVHAAHELQRHAPWLFAAMFVNALIAMVAGAPEAHWIVRIGMPAAMAGYCLFSLVALRTDWQFTERPWSARKFLGQAALSSMIGAAICTCWGVLSWLAAPAGDRAYFPIILIMGGLATAYCLANVKVGAFANLGLDIVPISLLMIASGHPPEMAAAISFVLAGLFQVGMIRANHRRVIALLVLQKQTRDQANSDSLTGLANRRALWERMTRTAPGAAPQRLILIDIDHFKAINDGFGHHVGDTVLCELAEIIAALAPPGTLPARIGGEEFALFGPADVLDAVVAHALLHDIGTAEMPHGRQVTASIGIAHAPIDEDTDWAALYQAADSALYRAKREGRNRLHSADGAAHPDAFGPALEDVFPTDAAA